MLVLSRKEEERVRITVRGVEYVLIRGKGFRFPVYRERYLIPLRDKYYRVASWMPEAACPFLERNDLTGPTSTQSP